MIRSGWLFMVAAFFVMKVSAQGKGWSLRVSSQVEIRTWKLTTQADKDERELGGATITLTQGGKLVQSIQSGPEGDFMIDVPGGGEYLLTVSYGAYNKKIFYVNTNGVPADIDKEKFKPTFAIGGFIMAKAFPGIDYSILNQPLVKVIWQGKKFDDDESYTNSMLDGLGKVAEAENKLIEEFCNYNKQGDMYLKKPDCPKAKEMYEKAISLLKDEAYPRDQLVKVGQCLKDNEAQAKAKADADAKAKAEADAKAKAELEAKAKKEAEAKAKAEAEVKAKAEAEAKAKVEAETKAKAEAQEKAKKEAEAKAKAEAEAKAKVEAEARTKADAENKARADAEAKVKKEADARAKAEADAKAKGEADSKAKINAEAKAKADAEAKSKKEAELKAKNDARVAAEAQAKAKAKASEAPVSSTVAAKGGTAEVNHELKRKPVEGEPSKPATAGTGSVKHRIPQVLGANKYKETIKQADDYFKMKRWQEAKKAYEEALEYKADDAYAKARIEACDKAINK